MPCLPLSNALKSDIKRAESTKGVYYNAKDTGGGRCGNQPESAV